MIRFIIAAFFSILIVLVIPFFVGNDSFHDIGNYVARILVIEEFGADFKTELSVKTYILEEQIWSYYLLFSVYLGLEPIVIVKIASIIASFLVFFMILTISSSLSNGTLISVLLLINPLYIDLVNAQVRSALAVSLLYFSLFVIKGKYIRLLYIALAMGIHTVSVLYVILYSLYKVFISKFDFKSSIFISVLASISIGLFVAFGLGYVLDLLGDRRGQVFSSGSSIKFSLFWLALSLLSFVFYCRYKISDLARFSYFFSILFCSMFFILSVFNIYGSRWVALFLPFIIFNIVNSAKYRTLFIISFVSYEIVQIIYWV